MNICKPLDLHQFINSKPCQKYINPNKQPSSNKHPTAFFILSHECKKVLSALYI